MRIQNTVERAAFTLKTYAGSSLSRLAAGKIADYQVTLKMGFTIQDTLLDPFLSLAPPDDRWHDAPRHLIRNRDMPRVAPLLFAFPVTQ